jgi:RND family efflux transporter MFP subunit
VNRSVRLVSLACLALLATHSAAAAEYPATIDWSGRVDLGLAVSGTLERIDVRPGQRVRKGESLAALEAMLYKAGVAEARAELDRMTQEEADSARELERARELYARTVTPTSEMEAAQLRHARASAGLAAAQARVERARRLLAQSELLAPFDAVILARHAEPGLVTSAQCQPAALLTVARADQVRARAVLDAEAAANIVLDAAAEVQVGDRLYAGQVDAVSALDDGSYLLDVRLPRAAGVVPGMAARVRLQ